MASKPATVWDDKAHLDLLQAVLTVTRPDGAAWDHILMIVQSKGYNYTASAAQYIPPPFSFPLIFPFI